MEENRITEERIKNRALKIIDDAMSYDVLSSDSKDIQPYYMGVVRGVIDMVSELTDLNNED